MPITLQPFTATPLIQSLNCEVWREQDKLHLDYRLVAQLEALNWPAAIARPQRRMGLWQHTCFECFLGAAVTAGYTEVNVSPNGDWNCFGFQDYRLDMQVVAQPTVVSIAAEIKDQHQARVHIVLDLQGWSAGLNSLQLGLAAVIQDNRGSQHYYALQHIDANPDFHHRDTHILTIPWGIE